MRILRAVTIVVGLATAIGCAAHHHCRVQLVPLYWADGTVSLWSITTCAVGR